MWMFFTAQARLVANSPSGCAIPCNPAGEMHSGKAMDFPSTVVRVLACETFFRTRGRMRYLSKALLFSWRVCCAVAPELKNSEGWAVS